MIEMRIKRPFENGTNKMISLQMYLRTLTARVVYSFAIIFVLIRLYIFFGVIFHLLK